MEAKGHIEFQLLGEWRPLPVSVSFSPVKPGDMLVVDGVWIEFAGERMDVTELLDAEQADEAGGIAAERNREIWELRERNEHNARFAQIAREEQERALAETEARYGER